MANFNRITLLGNLVADPDLRYIQGGVPVAKFTVAVNHRSKLSESVDYIAVVAWRKLAETSTAYLKKGMLVLVEGRLAIRSYESKGGEKHRAAEVVMASMQMLEHARANGRAGEASAPPAKRVE